MSLRARNYKFAVIYIGLIGVPLIALALTLGFGQGLSHQAVPRSVPSQGASGLFEAGGSLPAFPPLALLVAQIIVVILLSRAVGYLAERVHQPRVIGEVLAGILLGPSFLGWVAPDLFALLFPERSFGILNALSQLGLMLFMFTLGLDLDLREIGRRGHVALLISHASIAAPMALGAILALYLYPELSGATIGFRGFALFMGAAMSVTAFPVLARILSDRNLLQTKLGTMAIACAAIDDVTGWCVLAYIVADVHASQASILSAWITVAGLAAFLLVMCFGLRRPLLRIERAYLREGRLSDDLKAIVLLVLLVSAFATEALGLHLLFGAFIAGAVMPKHHGMVSYLVAKFQPLTVLLLLPLFFAYTGLRTNIGQVKGLHMWLVCLLIIAVAVVGKIGGTGVAARFSGLAWRESLALGALMNTRGLMELVVLNIGADIKIISPPLFSMMVVMAVATTMMTPPLLARIHPIPELTPDTR